VGAHNANRILHNAPEYVDPGDAGTITVDRSPCACLLASAGAETRTLARPTKAGVLLYLGMKTDGGDITLTVTGGVNEDGDTTFVFSDAGQFLFLASAFDGTDYYWRTISTHLQGNLTALSATEAELNYLDQDAAGNVLTRGAGVDTAESYVGSIQRVGGLIITRIVIDVSTLIQAATDLDSIGESAAASCHFGQITAAKSGTIIGGKVTCLEAPAGGSADIDFYSSNVSTGTQDVIITDAALGTETALVTSGGAWASGTTKGMTGLPTANDYIYLTSGAAAGGTLSAGKFLIEFYGVAA
jgi:hypothetical protein